MCILYFPLRHCTYPVGPPFPTTNFVYISLYSTSLYIPCSSHLFPTTYFVYTSLYSTSLYIPCSSHLFPSTYFVHTSFYSTSLYILCRTPLFPTTYYVHTLLYSTSLCIPRSTPLSPKPTLCMLHFALRHCTYPLAPPSHHLLCVFFTLLYVTVHTL